MPGGGEQNGMAVAAGRTPAVVLVGKPAAVPGHIDGLRQPCLRFQLAVAARCDARVFIAADAWMAERFGPAPEGEEPAAATDDPCVLRVTDWTRRILKQQRHPIFEHARLRAGPPVGEGVAVWTIVQPCLDFDACEAAVELAIGVIVAAAGDPSAVPLAEMLEQLWQRHAADVRKGALGGFNTLHFLEAAHAMGLPWRRLSGSVFQYGMAAAARLLDSSLTDRSPLIATALAKDKMRAAAMLREAGLPVPEHHRVASAEEAVAAAEALGYPVVVKPADKDGGTGVAAFLHDGNAVRKAYVKAAEHSQRILVEAYVAGNDYRVHIVDGVVHGVLERAPGGVVGDGRHDVRQLVERQNRERATATDDRRHLHPIHADEEAGSLLAAAGLGWESVPAEGAFVRLRGASNVAGGGIPRPVAVADVHPDNLALALRAVGVLRLDVAGVDLLMPDITQSWLQTGAGICEINAMPQMFTTFHRPMLESIMGPRRGRIPIAVVLSHAGAGEAASMQLHRRLRARWPAAGLTNGDTVMVGDEVIVKDHPGSFFGVQALMLDPAVEALVVAVSDRQVLRHGWPFDRCDALLLAGGDPPDTAPDGAEQHFLQLCAAAKALQPAMVFADAGDGLCMSVASRPGWRAVRKVTGASRSEAPGALAAAAADWIGKAGQA